MVGREGFISSSPEVMQFLTRQELLIITKANARSTVHRPVHLDYVGVRRFDAAGKVIGERRFVGLFTSAAYNRNPRDIPVLRRKVRRVVERAGFPPQSHDGKALLNILETYPRDELFQIGEDELYATAIGILLLQQRPRIGVFGRRDEFGRYVSFLVYVPRERYDSQLRMRIAEVLAAALNWLMMFVMFFSFRRLMGVSPKGKTPKWIQSEAATPASTKPALSSPVVEAKP